MFWRRDLSRWVSWRVASLPAGRLASQLGSRPLAGWRLLAAWPASQLAGRLAGQDWRAGQAVCGLAGCPAGWLACA